jgi:hypothetical protein
MGEYIMFYDNFVLSDQHAKERHQAILREMAQIRLADRVAAQTPSLPRRAAQAVVMVLMTIIQR